MKLCKSQWRDTLSDVESSEKREGDSITILYAINVAPSISVGTVWRDKAHNSQSQAHTTGKGKLGFS